MQGLQSQEEFKKVPEPSFEYSYLSDRRTVGFTVSGFVEFICHSSTTESAFTVRHKRPCYVHETSFEELARVVLKVPTAVLEAVKPALMRGAHVKVDGIVRGYERTIERGSKVELMAECIMVLPGKLSRD